MEEAKTGLHFCPVYSVCPGVGESRDLSLHSWEIRFKEVSRESIMTFLAAEPESWFRIRDISKGIGPKSRFREEPDWPRQYLQKLEATGLVERNESNEFRIHPDENMAGLMAEGLPPNLNGRIRALLSRRPVQSMHEWTDPGLARWKR